MLYCRTHGVPLDTYDRECCICLRSMRDSEATVLARRAHHIRESLIKLERSNEAMGRQTVMSSTDLLKLCMIHASLEHDEDDVARRDLDTKPTPAQSMSNLRKSSLSLTGRKRTGPNLHNLSARKS